MNPAQASNSHRAESQFKRGTRTFTRKVLVRLSALFVLVGLAGVFMYSSSHASNGKLIPASAANVNDTLQPGSVLNSLSNGVTRSGYAVFTPFVDPVTISEDTCTSAQSTFNLNDSVCVTATGSQFIGQRLVVVDPQNVIRSVAVIASSPTVLHYPIPNTTTTPLVGGFVDDNNLGTWTAYIVTGRGGKLFGSSFVVKDPAKATANVEIHMGRPGGDAITAGSTVTYDITLVNYGPDAAVNAQFTNPTPAFTTFQGETIPTSPAGITCTDPGAGGTGDVVCTVPSLAANTSVTINVQYLVGSVGTGSSVESSASLTTDTANISGATSATDAGKTTSTGTVTGCTLTCPANIVVTADTTGPDPSDPSQTVSGAIVTFSTDSTGTCGTITSSPASGTFFPVGTTPVTSTSSDGGGECNFTVTVTQSGGALSISCPANQIANADSNCSATVTLGTPTTTGDNVTVHGTRSDGLPMYDCSIPGPGCVHDGARLTTDLPFPVGVTTVTWTATNASGTESCTQTVTVYDVTPPTITATDSTASADANCVAAVPDYSTAATDNCACNSSDTSQICDSRHDIAVTQDVAPGTLVGPGTYTIHLTANDGSVTPGPDGIIGTLDDIQGNVALKTITFTVVDTTPPSITAPGPVTAYTGAGATTCDTVISDAVLGTPTTSDNCGPITVTRSPSGNTFPVGSTTVVWTATDGAGNHTSANQTVTVIDNTPPVITLNGQTPSMWPPDHTMHTFQVTDFVTSVFDNCGGVSVGNVVITQVTSDELDDATGGGDGNTVNDIQLAADCKSVQLRSERDGSGDGRVYTITFRLTDTHGNVTTATAHVVVAHDIGSGPEPVVNSGVHYTVNGNCP
jgi:uncharacterized repeat protein (TIGR01451 family)